MKTEDPCFACALRTAAALGWVLDGDSATMASPRRRPPTWNNRSRSAGTGVMAESPELLAGYTALCEQFQAASLPAKAKHVVLVTASVAKGCAHCVAAHSTMALRADLDRGSVAALRAGAPVADPALEAVHVFTRAVVENRGGIDDEQVDAFLAAGYTRRHVLDVVLGVGVRTLANYTNHIGHTPHDQECAPSNE
jgi:AhpD family alkylhydroperoxidase